MGSGMSTPNGGTHMCIGGPYRVSPMHTGAELRLKKKGSGVGLLIGAIILTKIFKKKV